VEGSHAALKVYISDSKSSLATVWDRVHSMLCNQIKEIEAFFSESMLKIYRLMGNKGLFRNFTCRVSLRCLDRLRAEYEKGVTGKVNKVCRCSIRMKFGIPCVHDMKVYIEAQQPLPLESVHIFWRTLSIEAPAVHANDQYVRRDVNQHLINDFVHNDFTSLTLDQQAQCMHELQKIAHPERTDAHQFANVVHKGRPPGAANKPKPPAPPPFGIKKRILHGWEKNEDDPEMFSPPKKQKSPTAKDAEQHNTKQKAPTAAMVKKYKNKLCKNKQYHGYFPEFVHPHIVGWYYIRSDGHCGFRSLACGLGDSQEAWKAIRTQLEIYTNFSWGEIKCTMTSGRWII